MFERILAPVDGSDASLRALDAACDLTSHYSATLLIVHVSEYQPPVPRLLPGSTALETLEGVEITDRDVALGQAHAIVNEARARAHRHGVGDRTSTRTEFGNPSRIIHDIADEERVDLIVMGRRGTGALAGVVLGSVSHRVSTQADCACLTIR